MRQNYIDFIVNVKSTNQTPNTEEIENVENLITKRKTKNIT
jgi:hypothetical protein